jgi:beta-phosphoglucomutase
MIKAVIFDMDGVLIDSVHYHYLSWKRLINQYGKDISEPDFRAKLSGRPATDTIRILLGKQVKEEEIEKFASQKETWFRSLMEQDFREVPGATEFIILLKKAKFKLAIATSADKENLAFNMRHLQIERYLDLIMTADHITHPKPHPEIYLKTAEKLGVSLEECIVFEDSKSGVASAKAAGMKVILVMTSHAKEEFSDVELAIKDFTTIRPADILKLK